MLRVAHILTGTTVNGPGERTVIHLQGCQGMPCAKVCFNPGLHPAEGGTLWDPELLARHLSRITPTQAYTISGGEPFQQPEDLETLLFGLGFYHGPEVLIPSIIIFTGYTREHLLKTGLIEIPIRWAVDALIAGPYNPGLPHERGLCSSSNQELVLLSKRCWAEDFDVPLGVEVMTDEDGQTVLTGFPDQELLEGLR